MANGFGDSENAFAVNPSPLSSGEIKKNLSLILKNTEFVGRSLALVLGHPEFMTRSFIVAMSHLALATAVREIETRSIAKILGVVASCNAHPAAS